MFGATIISGLRCDLQQEAGGGERRGGSAASGEPDSGQAAAVREQTAASSEVAAAAHRRTRQDGEEPAEEQENPERNRQKLPSNWRRSAECRGGETHFMPPHLHCSSSLSLRHAGAPASKGSLCRANPKLSKNLQSSARSFQGLLPRRRNLTRF